MIISKDMISGDKVASEILAYPFHLVKYAMINTKSKNIDYTLHPDSNWPDQDMLKQIKEHVMDYGEVNFRNPFYIFNIFYLIIYKLKRFHKCSFSSLGLTASFIITSNLIKE